MPITGQKFLITGGASLIGSHLTRALLAAGAAEVVLYDNLSLGSAALLDAFGPDARVRSIRGDVLRLPQLLDAVADVERHLRAGRLSHAAVFGESRGRRRRERDGPDQHARSRATERSAPGRLCLVGRRVRRRRGRRDRRVARVSSSRHLRGRRLVWRLEAAGREPRAACTRNDTASTSAHCASRRCTASSSTRAASTRSTSSRPCRRLRAGRPVVVRGSGDEAHDYVYAGDVARACVRAMDSAGANGAFNVASGRSTSVNEIVALVLEEYGSSLEPEHVADTRTVRSTAHHELRISTARAKEILGWEPAVPLREGISRVRRWLDTTGS